MDTNPQPKNPPPTHTPIKKSTQGKVLDGEGLYWVVETLLAAGRLDMAVDVFR